MRGTSWLRALVGCVLVGGFLAAGSLAWSAYGYAGEGEVPRAAPPQHTRSQSYPPRRVPPRFPDAETPRDGRFVFARAMYRSVRREWLGHGWNTDYPDSDRNFMNRLEEFTYAGVSRQPDGDPNHVVIRLTDPELFDYPFLFMSDVGTVGFDELEAERLREYLLKGGFLYVDDFWGDHAWEHWRQEIGRVLPPSRYPIVEISRIHPILRTFYNVPRVPQVPSIQFWRQAGGHQTSERGRESDEPNFRGILDEDGRLMVLMTHNTDIADGWEREMEEYEFFDSFSAKSYSLGINIVVYALSH